MRERVTKTIKKTNSSKKSIGSSTTTSTFYMLDPSDKILSTGINKIKIKTKKSMKSILDVKTK
jgi:hypothetical protein